MLHFYVLLAVVLVVVSDAFKISAPVHTRLHTSVRNMLMTSRDFKVGIVGASGAVGEEILRVMEKRKFPAGSIKLFASEKSAGKG